MDLMYLFFISCHIKDENINGGILLYLSNIIKKTYDKYPSQTYILRKYLELIDKCEDFDIKYLKKLSKINTYDLSDMFSTLKIKTNNFSENKLKLTEITTFYSFDLDEKIDEIITLYNELIKQMYLKCNKIDKNILIKAKKEYEDKIEIRKDFEIKKCVDFKITFINLFLNFFECYEDKKYNERYYYSNKGHLTLKTIDNILNLYYQIYYNYLNIFLFFLNEIYLICSNFVIDIQYTKIFFSFKYDMKENFLRQELINNLIRNFELFFINQIFKKEYDTNDTIYFLYNLFKGDNRKLDTLMRLYLLKMIRNYFSNTTDIKNFINGLKNITKETIIYDFKDGIRDIKRYDDYIIFKINTMLNELKYALIILYDKIMDDNEDEKSLLYKGFLYLLMLYLLIINNNDIRLFINNLSIYIKSQETELIDLYKTTTFNLNFVIDKEKNVREYIYNFITTDKEGNRRNDEKIKEILKLLYKYLPHIYTEFITNHPEFNLEEIGLEEIGLEEIEFDVDEEISNEKETSIIFSPLKIDTPKKPLIQPKPNIYQRLMNKLGRIQPTI